MIILTNVKVKLTIKKITTYIVQRTIMGCSNSSPSVLERYAGEALAYRADISNEVTSIYISPQKTLWKVCQGEAPVIRVTFMNNYRVQHLPPSPWIVRPQKLFQMSQTRLAVSMICHSTDLFNYTSSSFDFKRVLEGMGDVANGITFLHSKGLAHRDVKLENIVVGPKHFRLIDFDFTSPLTDRVHCGTPGYIVPLSISEKWDCSNRTRSIRYDVYAYGKTIIHLFYRAALMGMLDDLRFATCIYKKTGILEGIKNPYDGNISGWFDVALRCCQREPVLETFPTTNNTVDTLEVVYTDNVPT